MLGFCGIYNSRFILKGCAGETKNYVVYQGSRQTPGDGFQDRQGSYAKRATAQRQDRQTVLCPCTRHR